MAGLNPQLTIQKQNSKAQITLAIAEHGPVSKSDLTKITGLSISCVNHTVHELIVEGEIREAGLTAVSRGRPGVLLEIDRSGAPVAGVWIGPDSIEIAVANPGGDILAKRLLTYQWEFDRPDLAVMAIAQGIRHCADSAGRNPETLRGIGVTVAGSAIPTLGTIERVIHRPGWENVPVARFLGAEMGVPVYVDDGIHGIALYHHWFSGEGRDGTSVYVIVIEGLGAAIVTDQEVVRGEHQNSGHLGHTTVDPDGPLCPCGGRGCLELYASDIAFIHNVWTSETRSAAEIPAPERIELVRRGMELAKSGDPHAVKALQSVTKYLGVGVANLIRILDPRTIFICGTLVDNDQDLVLDSIRRETMPRISPSTRGVEIVALPGVEDCLLKGAFGLVLWQPYRGLRQEARNIAVAPRKMNRSSMRGTVIRARSEKSGDTKQVSLVAGMPDADETVSVPRPVLTDPKGGAVVQL